MKKQPGGKTQPFSLRKQFLAMSAIVLVLGMIGIGFLQLRQWTDDKRRQAWTQATQSWLHDRHRCG
jgi:hypothetical protein